MPRASLTRQHFVAFAEAISKMEGRNVRERVVEKLIPCLRRFNSTFDEQRFRRASKTEQPVDTSRDRSSTTTVSYSASSPRVQTLPRTGAWTAEELEVWFLNNRVYFPIHNQGERDLIADRINELETTSFQEQDWPSRYLPRQIDYCRSLVQVFFTHPDIDSDWITSNSYPFIMYRTPEFRSYCRAAIEYYDRTYPQT